MENLHFIPLFIKIKCHKFWIDNVCLIKMKWCETKIDILCVIMQKKAEIKFFSSFFFYLRQVHFASLKFNYYGTGHHQEMSIFLFLLYSRPLTFAYLLCQCYVKLIKCYWITTKKFLRVAHVRQNWKTREFISWTKNLLKYIILL